MPDIDIVDSTWIDAPPALLGAIVADPANWRRWWPELDLAAEELRAEKGVRWTVRPTTVEGESGSMEIWLEPAFGGVVLHYFLRLAAAGGHRTSRARQTRRTDFHRRRAKATFWALGDQLDPARTARVAASRPGSSPGPGS
jgi:hypothetical protein